MSNHHANLFTTLFHIALPHMKGYQSDLGWDAITLSKAQEGERYVWQHRECGTTLILVPSNTEKITKEWVMKHHPYLSEIPNIYVVTVTKKHNVSGCAEGTVEKIKWD